MNVIIQSYRGVYSVCCPLPSCPVRAVVNKLTPMAAMGWHIELLGLRWVGSPRPQRYDNKLSTLKFSKLVSIYFLKDKKTLSCLGTFSDQKCLHPPVILFLWDLEKGELFHFITRVGRKRMVQWWEDSPPTNVAQVRILALMLYVHLVCCWFSPLLREVFPRVLQFSHLLKNWHFQIPTRFGTHEHVSTSSYELLRAQWVNKLQ